MSHDGERNDGVHKEQYLNSSSSSDAGSSQSTAAGRITIITLIRNQPTFRDFPIGKSLFVFRILLWPVDDRSRSSNQ